MAPRVSSFLISSEDKTHSVASSSESTKDYLSRSWIPVSSDLISKVEELFNQDKSALVDLIKNDLGACAYYIKNISEYAGTDEFCFEDIFTEQALYKFVHDIKTATFNHKLQKAPRQAISALKFALISTTTAQTVAPQIDLDPLKTYMCSLTKQMGQMLVAWNYPRIFARAQSIAKDNGSCLDKEIAKILGSSPVKIASEICLDWKAGKEIKNTISELEAKRTTSNLQLNFNFNENSDLEKLGYCMNLGDAMARIADPEHYPQHSKQWQAVSEELKTCLGSDAIDIIQSNLSGISKTYSSNGFNLPISLEPRKNLTHTAIFRVTDRLLAENEWIEKCHKLHQERFRRIYGLIDKRGISTDALNELITNLVPDLGFTKGCVYRFDENKMLLTPILRIGKSELKNYKLLSCSDAKCLRHPAVMSVSYSTPLVQDNVLVDNQWVTAIAAVTGKPSKKTVLYVELSEEMAASIDRREAIVHFKAIQKALSDCINLD